MYQYNIFNFPKLYYNTTFSWLRHKVKKIKYETCAPARDFHTPFSDFPDPDHLAHVYDAHAKIPNNLPDFYQDSGRTVINSYSNATSSGVKLISQHQFRRPGRRTGDPPTLKLIDRMSGPFIYLCSGIRAPIHPCGPTSPGYISRLRILWAPRPPGRRFPKCTVRQTGMFGFLFFVHFYYKVVFFGLFARLGLANATSSIEWCAFVWVVGV